MSPNWRPPTLETDRLILRAVSEADADAVFAACSNPGVTRFTLFDTHTSLDDTLGFVRHYAAANYADQVPDPFGIVLKQDPDAGVIGAIGCRRTSYANKTMELGYWLAEHLWGRGLVAEAGRAVVDYTFAHCEVERIQAQVIVGNPASVRVLEKLGFRYEGTLRSALYRRGRFEDVLMFALLRTDDRR